MLKGSETIIQKLLICESLARVYLSDDNNRLHVSSDSGSTEGIHYTRVKVIS